MKRRKIFKYTGFFCFLSYILFLIFYIKENPLGIKDILLLVFCLLVFVFLYFLIFKFASDKGSSGNKIFFSVLLSLLLFPMIILAFSFHILIYFNFPLNNEFEMEININELSEKDQDNLLQYEKRIEQFQEAYDLEISFAELSEVKTEEEEVREVLIATEEKRKQVFEFLKNNVVYFPAEYSFNIGDVFYQELAHVKKELNNNKIKKAQKRYNDLWLFANDLHEIEAPIPLYYIKTLFLEELIYFYFDNADEMDQSELEGEVIFGIIDNYEWYYRDTLAAEYRQIMDLISRDIEETRQKHKIRPVLLSWPFLDQQKLKKELHDFYWERIEEASRPFYLWEEKADTVSSDYVHRELKDFVANPAGKVLYTIFRPSTSLLNNTRRRSAETKSRLKMFGYVIGIYQEPPVDPLTGELFQISETKDYLTIRSGYEGNGKQIEYKIKKAKLSR